ncbi:O-antigen ligase family protein [Aestuariibaculum sediminum]|uniref:O-antigen ligase family protein n=1 Tax=Aestuariibaculum sediminum TaxID=2770637 RepID=A0A8J6Q1S1_9FLAO|nr:O-antigen ligase family protein [Aestuariibaculum sediminum]MBD0831206.1 O-antigen ligase family protein [Aestuariibaculum sediminum]
MLNNFFQNKNSYFTLLAGLILPSLLLPIKYSSIVLILLVLITFFNLKKKNYIRGTLKTLMIPFILYYISIVICFIVDIDYGILNFDFLLRNLVVLIVPFYVFTSNFSRQEINTILKTSTFLISIFGLILILFWSFGYLNYFNKQEFTRNEWIKSDIKQLSGNNDSIFKFQISDNMSFRRIGSLPSLEEEDSIVRELTVRVSDYKHEIWVYFRNFNNSQSQGAWFNLKTGEIGKVQKGVTVESFKLKNGFFKFVLKDKPDKNLTREWFHFSIVDNNGGNKWKYKELENRGYVELLNPKFYSSSGEDFLKKKPITNYKITKFSFIENYAHGTYIGLVFTFSLLFLIFRKMFNKWVRLIFILLNVFVILGLASKAVMLCWIILLPIFSFRVLLRYKWLSLSIVIVISLYLFNTKNYMIARFTDMYQTLLINDQQNLGDLENLSTSQRLDIYKEYLILVKQKWLNGYGNINGKAEVKTLFNHDFNAHNQFIQSFFNSGVLGFTLFIFFCLSPVLLIKENSKCKDELSLFLIMILFNFLFESLLYRQWGLILVSFSYALYFQIYKSKFRWYL